MDSFGEKEKCAKSVRFGRWNACLNRLRLWLGADVRDTLNFPRTDGEADQVGAP